MFGGNLNPSAKRDARTHDAEQHTSQKEHAGEGAGDGFHHHEIHETESGYHSVHTHPDGKEDHADHADLAEASAHMHQAFGQEDMGKDDSAIDSDSGESEDGPDFSGAYCK